MRAGALQIALALFERPTIAADLRRSPIPHDVLSVMRIAAGDEDAFLEAEERTGASRERIEEAATFYLQQVLLHPDADPYRVLGCAPGAPLRMRREHMRWLMLWLHPDHNKDSWENHFAERVLSAWQKTKDDDETARAFPPVDDLSLEGIDLSAPTVPVDRSGGAFSANEKNNASKDILWRGVTVAAFLVCLIVLFNLPSGVEERLTALPEIALEPTSDGLEEFGSAGQPDEQALIGNTSPEWAAGPLPGATEEVLDSSNLAATGGGIEGGDDGGQALSRDIAIDRAEDAVVPAGTNLPAAAVEPESILPAEAALTEDETFEVADGRGPISEGAPSEGAPPAVMPSDGDEQSRPVISHEVRTINEPVPSLASLASDAGEAFKAGIAQQAVDRTPELSPERAEAVLDRFLRTYEAGDLEALLRLFSQDARNNRGGWEAIREDYAELFDDSVARHLVIMNMQWERFDESITGGGRFLATVSFNGRRREREVSGEISITITREGTRLLISEIHHKNDFL